MKELGLIIPGFILGILFFPLSIVVKEGFFYSFTCSVLCEDCLTGITFLYIYIFIFLTGIIHFYSRKEDAMESFPVYLSVLTFVPAIYFRHFSLAHH